MQSPVAEPFAEAESMLAFGARLSLMNQQREGVADVPGIELGAVATPPSRPPRPIGLWILTLALVASPLVNALALLLGRHWLNFGSTRAWDAFVYFVIAPIVGTLMARRHERARFSGYVFLSCEILRAWRIHSPALGVLALGAILYLQTPGARRFHPSVDPRRVLERIRLRRPS